MVSAPSVVLRPVELGDQARLRGWRNQPDVRRWMYNDHEIGVEEHARWFAAVLAQSRPRHWIITVDEKPVGLVNLYGLDEARRSGAWAYYIAEEGVRGQGVGAVVEYLTLETAFGRFGLEKLSCEVLADNEAVVRLHESFGFQREALLRQHVIKNGAPADVIGLGLLAQDWAARREASRTRLLAKGFTV